MPRVRFSKSTNDKTKDGVSTRKVDLAPMTVVGGTFLGTLRADEEESVLSEPFASLLVQFDELIGAREAGNLSDEATGRALGELVCHDRSGASWTLGATSRQWYRRQRDGSWVATPIEYGINAGAGLGR